MAILITGTPGVGKTTLSTLLSEKTGRPHIELAELVKREKLYVGYDERSQSYIVDEERVKKRLRDMLTCKEIVDTHVVSALPREKISLAIVLRLDPQVLEKRLKQRRYPPVKIKSNVESEILGYVTVDAVNLFGEERVNEIDVTGLTPEETLKLVLSIIEGVERRRPGKIDWLEKYWGLLQE